MTVRDCDRPLVPLDKFVDVMKTYIVSRDDYAVMCSKSPSVTHLLKKLSKLYKTCILVLMYWVSRWHSGRELDFRPSGRGFSSRSGHYQAPRSTQPSIPVGFVNRVPAFTGWG